MEESMGAQYALQIALQTMKERCQQLQQRITAVEEENVKLRSKCQEDSSLNDLSEVDALKQKVGQLTEQKSQLMQNVLMVATENRHLWNRLSKLTQANETLGGQLTKINDTLKQHTTSNVQQQSSTHTPLIRSKTFTQETPAIKAVAKAEKELENMSLEDISLKLINNIAKEKSELERQCSQMMEIQNEDALFTNPIGFAYPEDVQDSILDEFGHHLNDMHMIKDLLLQQNGKLQKQLVNMKIILDSDKKTCKRCDLKKEHTSREETEQLKSLTQWGAPECSVQSKTTLILTPTTKPTFTTEIEIDKICPMCSKTFLTDINFEDFQHHVESHFVSEGRVDSIDNFVVL